MLKSAAQKVLFGFILILLTITACDSQGGATSSPPAAIQGYLNALVGKDENKMINFSCAAWESQAKQEYNSFAAVELTLDDLACQETGQDGEYSLVSCTGSMIANYGAEKLEIDIAERNYRLVEEGGEWRMCGYQ